MRIKEIELDNFKSFGKPTRVPLLDGFTTISGPNGSGKSNIIDSLLFALGLSSTRTMRAERLPDLLNNLSGRNEAKVRVQFTNDAGAEIEVIRRLRVKDNGYTSSYYLNGRSATLTEIHEELMKYNVSPHGYNVIMQGDVTGIVTMSATERRKIIDELAGVGEFDRRIEQAGKELTAVSEKMDVQRIVLAEIAVRLEVLQNDRDQALKYLDLKGQKEKLERDLIFIRVKDCQGKLANETAALEKLDRKEEKLNEALGATEVELLTQRSEVGRIEQEIKDKGGNEQLLIRQELENLRGELTREENKLSNLNGVISEKAKSHKSLAGQIKVIDKRLNELTRDKKQNQDDLTATVTVLDEKKRAHEAKLAQIDGLRKAKDKSSDQVVSLHDDLQAIRDEKHKLEVRRTELVLRKESLEKELENIRNGATASIGRAAQLKQMLQSFDSKFSEQQAMVVGVARSIRQLEGELESTQEEIEKKRSDLEVVNRRIAELETRREVAGDSGYGKAVETVLAADIPGVHGTVGQLGRVQDKYTVALEIAIGGRLNHVVVEDEETASRCIQLLKQTGSGRATFVPLSKIQVSPPGLLPNKQGVIDFAYNLVDFNQKYAKAFQYACGQTVIVEDFDSAKRLMTQARMVTLGGELFEKQGSITGGADQRSRLHFSKNQETDLGAVKQKAKNLIEEIRWLQDSMKEVAAQLNVDRNRLGDHKTSQAQQQSDMDSKKEELIKLEKEIELLKPRLRTSGDEIEAVETEIASIDEKAKEVTKRLDKMQDQLSELTSSGKRSEIDGMIAESEELEGDLQGIEKSAQEAQRQIDRIETEERVEIGNRLGLQQQLDTLNEEMEKLNGDKPELEATCNRLDRSIKELEAKSDELSDELKQLHEQKEDILKKITDVEIERTKIGQNLEHLQEERHKRKLAYHALKEELYHLQEELDILMAEQPDYQPPNAATVDELQKTIDRLDKRMKALEPVNMKALDDYNTTKQRQEELDQYLEELTKEQEEINARIAGYDELKKRTFLETFNAIDMNFREIFAELSHGTGKLELENPENPFDGGLIIRAQPRDKKMQRIEALSGGEKSLTALSFVFAFQRYAPAPFYAFDEVDMMLDGANAERLARMVSRQSNQAQFVVVSLRRPMIENSDHAIGVSLRADGYSKVVGISEINIPEPPTSAGTPEGVGASA